MEVFITPDMSAQFLPEDPTEELFVLNIDDCGLELLGSTSPSSWASDSFLLVSVLKWRSTDSNEGYSNTSVLSLKLMFN